MLHLNPKDRWSVRKCLNSKIFDDIRQTDLEQPCGGECKLDIDDPEMFDYENFTEHQLDENQCRKLIEKEIQIVKQELGCDN